MNPAAIFLMIAALSAVSFKPDVSAKSPPAPPIAEVQRKAIDYARLAPSEISDWKKKARRSALLPKLQIEYDRRVRYDVNVDVNDSVYVGTSGANVGPESGAYSANQNQDNNISVKAVWSFSEAIFNPELLAVSEEARLLSRERQAILAEVNRNYYERDRLAGEMVFLKEDEKRDPRSQKIRQEMLAKSVAYNEAAAALDALTGGWFGEELKKAQGGLEAR